MNVLVVGAGPGGLGAALELDKVFSEMPQVSDFLGETRELESNGSAPGETAQDYCVGTSGIHQCLRSQQGIHVSHLWEGIVVH